MMSRATASKSKAPRPRGPRVRLQNRKDSAVGRARFVPSPSPGASVQPRSRATLTCGNVTCSSPNVVIEEDGPVCHTCGWTPGTAQGAIVAEVQFGENSAGAAVMQGSFVGQNQSHSHQTGGRGPRPGYGGDGITSREMTEKNARSAMTTFATALSVPQNLIDPAMQIFKLAMRHNFIQGRSIGSVAAISLYISCRRQPSTNTLMLIDLAEYMQMNVFQMGKTYSTMIQKIYSQYHKDTGDYEGIAQEGRVDPINPENLIYRFARELEFGDQVRAVTRDAVSLVRRMDRDWMTTGRRPAGICGAALVLAARMNNFRRTVREVVYIVKVCEITVNKRLEEFKFTESSNLSVEQFRTVQLPTSCDPPSFYLAKQSKQTGKRGRKRKAAPETAAEIEGDAEAEETGYNEGVKTVADVRAAKRGRIDKDGFAIPDIPLDPAIRTAGTLASALDGEQSIDEALTSAVNSAISEIENQEQIQTASASVPPSPRITSTVVPHSSEESSESSQPDPQRPGRRKRAKNWRAPPPSQAELALEAEIESDMRQILEGNSMQPIVGTTPAPVPTPPSSGQADTTRSDTSTHSQPTLPSIDQAPAALAHPVDPRTAGNLNNTPLSPTIQPEEFDSDPEVSTCLLTPSEIEIKERIWVSENAEWLRHDHAKKIRAELQAAADKAAGIDPNEKDARGKKRKRKRGRLGDVSYLDKDKNRDGGEAEEEGNDRDRARRSASRAMRGMLEQRGFSKRLNYDVMLSLFPDENQDLREGSLESRSLGMSDREGNRSRAGSGASKGGSQQRKGTPPGGTPAATTSPPPAGATNVSLDTPPALPAMAPTIENHVGGSAPDSTMVAQDDDEEEVIGSVSDSPLSSLPSTSGTSFVPAALGGAGGGEDDAESEGDSDDYVEEDDDVEAALEGRLQRRISYDAEEANVDDGEEP